MFNHYVYIYLNPLKPGIFNYGRFEFNYEPFYIGKGFNNRINTHLKEAKHVIENDIEPTGNRHKLNTIIKIVNSGFEPIRIKLYDNISDFSACRCECYLINLIGRHDLKKGPLTNMTAGGDGVSGYKHKKETKKLIGTNSKQRWVKNYDKYCKLQQGDKNGFYNKTHSNKNRKIFSETAKRIFTGFKQSDEHIKKKADAIRGEKNGMYGTNVYKKWLEKYGKEIADVKQKEFIKNYREGRNNPQYGKKGALHAAAKKIILVTPDNENIVFNCHEECRDYFVSLGLLKEGLKISDVFSYHALRHSSRKNKKYKGFLISTQ